MLCTGDGKRLCDLQRENQARNQCFKPELVQLGKGKAALSTSINSNLAVRVFDEVSSWLHAHSKDEWFNEQSSIETGMLLEYIRRDVFDCSVWCDAGQGFLRALSLIHISEPTRPY